MAIFKETVMVKDRPFDRAVEVTIVAPDIARFQRDPDEVFALAQKAWRAVNKEITIGEVKVKVRGFGR
jgi:hypothetical protein